MERDNPDFELLSSRLSSGTFFLNQDPWRVMRMQSDAIQSIEVMARALDGWKRTVAVFGSARLPESDPAYQNTRLACRHLGERGFAIITGGGPGIMEAANRGAREAGTLSIGLNIQLPHEQHINPYVDEFYTCHYFFVRKMMFAKYSQGFLIFPGGFGTLDELFESLTLIQTGKLAEFPVVLSGSDFWMPLMEWMHNSMWGRGCISEDDLDRFLIEDDPEQIAKTLDELIPMENRPAQN